jgi:hypothetical protein
VQGFTELGEVASLCSEGARTVQSVPWPAHPALKNEANYFVHPDVPFGRLDLGSPI